MVLPLIGLLAAAGGLAAAGSLGRGELDLHRQRRQGAYNNSLLDDVAGDDLFGTNRALFGGGALSGAQFTGNLFGETQSLRAEAGAERRSQRSAGSAAAARAESARQFDINNEFRNRPFDLENDPQFQRAKAAHDLELKAQERQISLQEAQSDGRGANWMAIDADDRFEIRSLETAYGNLNDVFDYVEQTTAAGRIASPAVTAQFEATFQTTILPVMQQMFEAGAMQKEELELFQEIAGNPFKITQLTDQELGRLKGVMGQIQSRYTNLNESNFLNPKNLGGTPAALQPYTVPDAVDRVQTRRSGRNALQGSEGVPDPSTQRFSNSPESEDDPLGAARQLLDSMLASPAFGGQGSSF